MTPELSIMRRPASAYARLAQDYPPIGVVQALRRPLLAAVAIGAAISIAATATATLPLLLSTAFCWTFAVAWQMLAAVTLVGIRHDSLTFGQRLDLFFAGHAPWSVWLLTCAAWSRLLPNSTDLYALLATAAIPAVWTAFVVHGFCTSVIGLPRGRALWHTLVHQGIIWIFVFLYIAWAIALWPRLQG